MFLLEMDAGLVCEARGEFTLYVAARPSCRLSSHFSLCCLCSHFCVRRMKSHCGRVALYVWASAVIGTRLVCGFEELGKARSPLERGQKIRTRCHSCTVIQNIVLCQGCASEQTCRDSIPFRLLCVADRHDRSGSCSPLRLGSPASPCQLSALDWSNCVAQYRHMHFLANTPLQRVHKGTTCFDTIDCRVIRSVVASTELSWTRRRCATDPIRDLVCRQLHRAWLCVRSAA